MALPASGQQIGLAAVQGEFGGTNPIQLSEYYKGGSYVLAGDAAPNVQGTVGQPISLDQFHGAGLAAAPGAPTITPGYAADGSTANSSGTVTTGTVTASAVGGTAPLSYSWAYVSGNALTAHPSGASCYWDGTVNQTVPAKSAIWRCTVTDAHGRSATSADVTVSIETTWSPP